MFGKLFFRALFLFALAFAGVESWGREVVVGLAGCKNASVVSAVKYSIEDIRPKAGLVLDSLYIDSTESDTCGYKMIRREDSTVVLGATTGVGLWLKIHDFFGFDQRGGSDDWINYDSVFSARTRYSYKAKLVSDGFKKRIHLKTGYDLEIMADSGAEFKAASSLTRSLPLVRLLVYGENEQYQFIYFESGGYHSQRRFVLEKNGSLVVNKELLYHPYKGLDRLKAILSR